MNLSYLSLVILFTVYGKLCSRKCPDVHACQCFWDLEPKTTSCRVNILQMKRSGLIQANTERLILHLRSAPPPLLYNVHVWIRLRSVFTVDRIYVCTDGRCLIDISTTETVTKSTKGPKLGKKTTFTTHLPGCFTTTEMLTVMRTSVQFTCSTQIYVEDISVPFPVWKIYVPLICVVIIILLLVSLYIFRRRRNSFRNANEQSPGDSNSSICLYDLPEISPSSPTIMESTLSSECVAQRTRSKCEPIAHRLRSKRKDS